MTGGFLLALAHRHGGLGGSGGQAPGLAGPGQTGRQHHGFLFTGVATGFSRQRIIVFADDVHLGALFLRRAAAQSFQLGAVVPIGPAGTPRGASGGDGGPEARAPRYGGRRGGGAHQFRRGAGGGTCFGGGSFARAARRWRRGTARGLLQLHQLAGGHRLAHASRHARADRGRCAAGTSTAVATNWLADQLQGRRSGTARLLPPPDDRGGGPGSLTQGRTTGW